MKPNPVLDRNTARLLEEELARAIAAVVEELAEKLSFSPDKQTMHFMAKAATATYEAVAAHAARSKP